MCVASTWENFGMFRICTAILALVIIAATTAMPLNGKNPPAKSKIYVEYRPFCSRPVINSRATLEDILYKGNVGDDKQYGCNLMLVGDQIAHQYDYIANLTNAAMEDQSCACWLKVGPNGGVNGFFRGNQVLDFAIPARRHVILAIEKDSQGGCACSPGGIQITPWGQFGSTWLEFDMGNLRNGAWSGADASCIVSAAHNLDIPGLQVCAENENRCSVIYPGGRGNNAFVKGMEAADGIGIIFAPGQVRLRAFFGDQQ